MHPGPLLSANRAPFGYTGGVEFEQLIETRYSVRGYRPDPIPEPLLQQVLRAGILAPTAANRQPFRILVLETESRRAELRTVYHREWFTEAPLILVVVAVLEEAWVRRFDALNHYLVDAAIVMDHMVLAAADVGLGTCWICAFDPHAARTVLALPPGTEPVAMSPLGYARDDGPPPAKSRRPPRELVFRNEWGRSERE